MLVTEYAKGILETMRYRFSQYRVFKLFQSHVISNLEMPGRHTVSNAICLRGREDRDWTREYRLFSTNQWDVVRCMNVILHEALEHIPEEDSFIPFAVDLTSLRKHGKRIPYTGYQADPLSPPFRKGIMWGQRFLHASLLVPMHPHALPARAIPVRVELCPIVHKPGKKATEEEWATYKVERKSKNASVYAMKMVKELTGVCQYHYPKKKVLIVADGGFCNRSCFGSLPENAERMRNSAIKALRRDCSTHPRSFGPLMYARAMICPDTRHKHSMEGLCAISNTKK